MRAPGRARAVIAAIVMAWIVDPSWGAETAGEAVPAETGTDATGPAAWVRQQARSLRPPKKRRTDDLVFLGPLLEGHRIVQLAQNGMGAREIGLMTERLIRHLHEELGFDLLVLEGPLDQCHGTDVLVASGDPSLALTACLPAEWHTKAVLRLFEYVQGTRAGKRPLRIEGIGIRPVGWNTRGRPALMREIVMQVDPGYAEEVLGLEREFVEAHAAGEAARIEYISRERDRLVAAYEKLAGFLEKNASALEKAFAGTGREQDPAVARQTALSMARYVRLQAEQADRPIEEGEESEEAMADNLEFVLRELHPGKKAILWVHERHLHWEADGPAPTVGSLMAGGREEEIYTIALFPGSGRITAAGGTVRRIDPPPPGTLEAILRGAGEPILYLDLSRAGESDGSEWIRSEIQARRDGVEPFVVVPASRYDAVVYVDKVTPSERID